MKVSLRLSKSAVSVAALVGIVALSFNCGCNTAPDKPIADSTATESLKKSETANTNVGEGSLKDGDSTAAASAKSAASNSVVANKPAIVDPAVSPESKFKFSNPYFEAPFRLMVDDEPLNTQAKQMYPSPAFFDVDNDGQTELVVGDIFGSINVYENKSDGQGDPVWSKHYALKAADGEAIKVSNW